MLSVGQLLFRDRAIVISKFFFRRAERKVVHSKSGDDEQWNIHIVILSEFEWRGWVGDSSDRDYISKREYHHPNVSWGVGREEAQKEAHMDREQDQEAGETW